MHNCKTRHASPQLDDESMTFAFWYPKKTGPGLQPATHSLNLLDTCSLSQLFLQRQRLQELLDTEVAYASRQNRVWLERGTVLPVQWGSSPPTNRDKLTTDVRIEFRHYKVDNHGNLIGKPTPWRLCQTLASKDVGTDTEDQVRANAAHFLTVVTDADGTHPRTECLCDLFQKAKGVFAGDQLHFDSHLKRSGQHCLPRGRRSCLCTACQRAHRSARHCLRPFQG